MAALAEREVPSMDEQLSLYELSRVIVFLVSSGVLVTCFTELMLHAIGEKQERIEEEEEFRAHWRHVRSPRRR